MDNLDRLPQLDQADANHVFYGGLLGYVLLMAGIFIMGLDARKAGLIALAVVLVVVVAKKIYDHIYWAESVEICVIKVFLTILWPASLLFALVIAHQ